MTIDKMLEDVIRREGPFNHLSQDKGGATNWGITQSTLAAWRGRPVSVQEVKDLTADEAKLIYKTLYYTRPGIDKIPDPLDDFIFDFAVNSGPQRAIQALQEVLGVTADGHLGPITLAAVLSHPSLRDLQNGVVKWRIMMFGRICRKDPSQLTFLSGWLKRALDFLV